MSEARLPTELWLTAALRTHEATGGAGYILHRGEKMSGTVLLIHRVRGIRGVKVYQQERDENGALGWAPALSGETVEDGAADAYSQRATGRDPDLWVVEIETTAATMPLEGPVLKDA